MDRDVVDGLLGGGPVNWKAGKKERKKSASLSCSRSIEEQGIHSPAPFTRSQTTTPFFAPVPTNHLPSSPTNSTLVMAPLGVLTNSEHDSVALSTLVSGSQSVTTEPCARARRDASGAHAESWMGSARCEKRVWG